MMSISPPLAQKSCDLLDICGFDFLNYQPKENKLSDSTCSTDHGGAHRAGLLPSGWGLTRLLSACSQGGDCRQDGVRSGDSE